MVDSWVHAFADTLKYQESCCDVRRRTVLRERLSQILVLHHETDYNGNDTTSARIEYMK